MSKTSGNVVNPLDLVDDVGVDGFRYYVLADTAVRQRRRLHVSRGSSPATTPISPTTSATSLARVATVVAKKCGGIGTAPRSRQPARRRRLPSAYADTAAHWDVVQPSRALDATWQLVRATNAHLEANEPWKAEPGPGGRRRDGRRPRGAAHRRRARPPRRSPTPPRRSGNASACPVASPTNGCPTRRRGAATSRRRRRHQGRLAVPRLT